MNFALLRDNNHDGLFVLWRKTCGYSWHGMEFGSCHIEREKGWADSEELTGEILKLWFSLKIITTCIQS